MEIAWSMPESIILAVQKSGDKTDCSKYRWMSLQ
jgi:hypothetical protein